MTKLWLETVRGREAREAWNRGQGRIEDESLWREKEWRAEQQSSKAKGEVEEKGEKAKVQTNTVGVYDAARIEWWMVMPLACDRGTDVASTAKRM